MLNIGHTGFIPAICNLRLDDSFLRDENFVLFCAKRGLFGLLRWGFLPCKTWLDSQINPDSPMRGIFG